MKQERCKKHGCHLKQYGMEGWSYNSETGESKHYPMPPAECPKCREEYFQEYGRQMDRRRALPVLNRMARRKEFAWWTRLSDKRKAQLADLVMEARRGLRGE